MAQATDNHGPSIQAEPRWGIYVSTLQRALEYTNAVIETYTNQKPSEITLGDGSDARIIITQE